MGDGKAKTALEVAARSVPAAAAALVPLFVPVAPLMVATLVVAGLIIQGYGDYGQERLNEELLPDLEAHKGEFKPEVLESDEFKAIFINVVEAHLKEVAAEKRKLYRNYLINVARGVQTSPDYHSKIFTVLSLITFEEIATLKDMTAAYDAIAGTVTPQMRHVVLPPTAEGLSKKLVQMGKTSYQGIAGARRLDLNMRLLQTYNLILIIPASESETNMRSSALESITEFGRTFLKFIADDCDH